MNPGYPVPKLFMLTITPWRLSYFAAFYHSLTWCLVKCNQLYLDLSDKNAFAELGPDHIDKVNAEILCHYQHLFKNPTTPFHKSSIDWTEYFFFVLYMIDGRHLSYSLPNPWVMVKLKLSIQGTPGHHINNFRRLHPWHMGPVFISSLNTIHLFQLCTSNMSNAVSVIGKRLCLLCKIFNETKLALMH